MGFLIKNDHILTLAIYGQNRPKMIKIDHFGQKWPFLKMDLDHFLRK